MPLQETSGAASYDAFGGGAPVAAKYIEDFFQTWLRTGTGSSTTVTTGLNASINKSLVWTKSRSAATNHKLTDTARGVTKALSSNTTGAEVTDSQGLTAFSSTGYTIGTNTDYNNSGATYVDWQWVATPKFFDVVTWTGNNPGNTTPRAIPHNLGSTPGCIIVKRTNGASNWLVYHRSLATDNIIQLNTTAAQQSDPGLFSDINSTSFSVGYGLNIDGNTYVACLFAHNAGGFGLTGTDNVISCGSYTGDSAAAGKFVSLGYEPQWVLQKCVSSAATDWHIQDVMRGAPVPSASGKVLRPNSSIAEYDGTNAYPAATGFYATGDDNNSGSTYIYIAIRRGPMKTPTSGTSVFSPDIGNNSTSAGGEIFTSGFPVDFFMRKVRATTDYAPFAYSRLTAGKYLVTGTTAAEATDTSTWFDTNTGINYQYASNFSGQIGWLFRRAPGFFDEVCYTGTGSARTVAHNLGVAPELMIVKGRTGPAGSGNWQVYFGQPDRYLVLNTTAAQATSNTDRWNNTQPTASVFSLGTANPVNDTSANTYVAYLFASCPGVSKVGSFTGTGLPQFINCGFTGGARFVMIKATSTTGNWLVWDSARGIVAGNDPYLALNSTAAEVTNTDWVDTSATGFELSHAGGNLANSNGVSYVFFAVA